MKKIIILKGVSNVGKTTKINKIAQWIIDNYNCPNTIDLDAEHLGNNTLGVLQVKNLLIGINASGDSEWEVKKIEKLKSENGIYPDIILCASRTKGKPRRYILDNFNQAKGWVRIFIDVKKHSDVVQQNSRDKIILDVIKTHLIGLEKIN